MPGTQPATTHREIDPRFPKTPSNLDIFYDLEFDNLDVPTCDNFSVNFKTTQTPIISNRFDLSHCHNFKMNFLGWVALDCSINKIIFWNKGDSHQKIDDSLTFDLNQYISPEDQGDLDYSDFSWLQNHLFLIIKYKSRPVLHYFLFVIELDHSDKISLLRQEKIDLTQSGFNTRFFNRMTITGRLRYSFERAINQD
jgi:hypothetical protein